MIKHTLARCLMPSLAGTVIGLATIISTIGSSVAAVQSVTINAPDKYSISHVVLFLQDSSGKISTVKIDKFAGGIMSYDPTKVLSLYPNSQLVAYSVKAGNNQVDGTSDALPVIIDSSVTMSQLNINQKPIEEYLYNKYPTGSTTIVAQTPPSSDTTTGTQTPPSSDTTTGTQTPPSSDITTGTQTPPTDNSYVEPSQPSSNIPNAPKTTQVPEPGTMAALALFGLGGLLAKKKVKS
ncbi:hypothetical protein NUACC21_75420 [Scytonema sp. NUACC21]